ncbi:MAG: MGMT family protein [Muribaculaceae bacterium]|nr:MGMT family protein [Muribaculaceae bacterium]
MKFDSKTFAEDVAQIVSAIPAGKVATYGDIAALAGHPAHARMVGKILGCIGTRSYVPCHRVVNVQGRTAPHWNGQLALLLNEGIKSKPSGLIDLKLYRWRPDIAD